MSVSSGCMGSAHHVRTNPGFPVEDDYGLPLHDPSSSPIGLETLALIGLAKDLGLTQGRSLLR